MNEPYEKGLNQHEKERDAGRDSVNNTANTDSYFSRGFDTGLSPGGGGNSEWMD